MTWDIKLSKGEKKEVEEKGAARIRL